MNFAKFLRASFFTGHLQWLLLLLDEVQNTKKTKTRESKPRKFFKKVREIGWVVLTFQFEIFKPLSYCFEEFDVKASFASRPVSRLIRWYNKNFDKRLFSSTGLFKDWKLQTELYSVLAFLSSTVEVGRWYEMFVFRMLFICYVWLLRLLWKFLWKVFKNNVITFGW